MFEASPIPTSIHHPSNKTWTRIHGKNSSLYVSTAVTSLHKANAVLSYLYVYVAFFTLLSVGGPQSCADVTLLLSRCYAGFCPHLLCFRRT